MLTKSILVTFVPITPYAMKQEKNTHADISLLVYNKYNDRGSVNAVLAKQIDFDGHSVRAGAPLPGWKWKGNEADPTVNYYDGEYLELTFRGTVYGVRTGQDPVELLDAACPGNGYVSASRALKIRLNHVCMVDDLPTWSELYAKGSFNALLINALPLVNDDRQARRWFMRTLSEVEYMSLLVDDTVSILTESAESGNPYAQFALGRYLLGSQREENSTPRAMDYFMKAWSKKLPEAEVSLAMAYTNGDMGMVDYIHAKTLLKEALNAQCEFAADFQVRKILYGMHDTESSPDKAISICDELIASDIACGGLSEVNPKWYFYKGVARQLMHGWTHGLDELRIAAEHGYIPAWPNIAIALSHNDNGEIIDHEAYSRAVSEGAEKREPTCAYFHAMDEVTPIDKYNALPSYKKTITDWRVIRRLHEALDIGSAEAAEELGDIYYSGQFCVMEDNVRAYSYYARGALLNRVTCFEKMYAMIHDHYIDRSQDTMDMLALHGARLGSKLLTDKTVIAYTYGRLTEFASEIEQMYVPLFDGDESESDDSDSDDDGRFDAYS